MLTGESLPAEKQAGPIETPDSPLELASCGFMGTVVAEGTGLGVLVVTICLYLVLIELGKRRFYRLQGEGPPIARPRAARERRILHRASRWSVRGHPGGRSRR